MIPLPGIAPVMRAHFPDGETVSWVFGDEVGEMTYTAHHGDFNLGDLLSHGGDVWLKVTYLRHGAKHVVEIRRWALRDPYGGLLSVYYPGFFTDPIRSVWRV